MLVIFELNLIVRNVLKILNFLTKKKEFFKTIYDKALTPFLKTFLYVAETSV